MAGYSSVFLNLTLHYDSVTVLAGDLWWMNLSQFQTFQKVLSRDCLSKSDLSCMREADVAPASCLHEWERKLPWMYHDAGRAAQSHEVFCPWACWGKQRLLCSALPVWSGVSPSTLSVYWPLRNLHIHVVLFMRPPNKMRKSDSYLPGVVWVIFWQQKMASSHPIKTEVSIFFLSEILKYFKTEILPIG